MKTLEEQYNIQVNEIKIHYRKVKIRRIIIFFTLTIICAVTSYLGWKLMKSDGRNYTWILFFVGIALSLWFAREFAYALFKAPKGKYRDINNLNREFDRERLRKRNDTEIF